MTTHLGLDTSKDNLTREQVLAAVEGAAVPVLLMVVYQVTGNRGWLDDRYRPHKFRGVAPRDTGGLSDEAQREVREAAVPVIEALLRGDTPALTLDDRDAMIEAASFFLGEPIDDRHAIILREELGRRAQFPTEPPQSKAPTGFRAIVIGAGISGLAAIQIMQQLNVDYTIFERGSEAGGVWYQNTYPGAGVDTPSHLYSFSFNYRDWEQHFELRDALHEYFNEVLDDLQARDRVQFDTEVLSATFDDRTALWTVVTRDHNGATTEHMANAVISTVGSLNQPVIPKVPGRDTFAGMQFHSNLWPQGVDLAGKRVAIVGVGASSQQISPEIAKIVDHLTIVQRSPQWVAPFDQFREKISPEQRTLLADVPLYRAWNWIGLFWQHGDKIIERLRIDPKWDHPERSVNAQNDRQRAFLTSYIASALEGRPDLIAKATPNYPPFGKRMLLDNGWYRTLKRDNVSLVADGVVAVDADGITFSSGDHLDVDVIIWATGFAAAHFLDSLEVYGKDGLRLREFWQGDDPRAFLGVSIPHYPNFFMLGGPHSLPGSGSFMYFMELQARYLRDLLATMFGKEITALSATVEATDRYNTLVDEKHEQTVWRHPGFATYYRNSKGRVIFVMPFLNVEYWEMVRDPALGDYDQETVAYVPAKEAAELR